jgi:hypothetical protein
MPGFLQIGAGIDAKKEKKWKKKRLQSKRPLELQGFFTC